ncbi:hypothetical protein [Bradyrhizobium oligotrophicum]|nr:hypothetical protein [Bradyrhizobium oligotrophicum]
MAGLVPAIHVFADRGHKDVDARDKPVRDEQLISGRFAAKLDVAAAAITPTAPRECVVDFTQS